MSNATMKTCVKRLAIELKSAGFIQVRPYVLKRSRLHIDQIIEVQLGTGGRAGQFTCNIGWQIITCDYPLVEGGYTCAIRIGPLIGTGDLWLPHEPKGVLDASIERLRRIIFKVALPLLDSVADLKRMLHMYEEAAANPPEGWPGEDSPLFFFGSDDGWRHYNLGLTYKVLGQPEKAREHLRTVVDRYSGDPWDWVRARQRACEEALTSLSV